MCLSLFAKRAACLAAMVSMAFAGTAVQAALTHHFEFNEAAGSSTTVDSVTGLNATVSGNAAITGTGAARLNLGGSSRDGLISMVTSATDPNGIDIPSYQALTVEFCATPNADASPPGITPNLNNSFSTAVGFGKINGTDPGLFGEYIILQTHRGDNVSRGAISFSDDGSPWDEESGANGAEINDNKRHHYALTIDPAAGSIAWYVDGSLAASGALSAGNSSLSVVSNDLALIGDAYPNDQNWAGRMHDLKIYDNVQSAADIAADAADCVPEPSSLALLLAGFGSLLLFRRK